MIKRCYSICFLIMTAMLLMSLTGCKSSDKASDPESSTGDAGEQIELYYLNADGNDFEKVSYTMQNPDDPYLAALEIIYMLSNKEDSSASNYKVVITQDVVVNRVEQKEDGLVVDLGSDYYHLSASDAVLIRTSLVMSLVQIDGVDSVGFTINGDELLDNGDNPMGAMDASSFILTENEEDLYGQEKDVTLYYANQTGDGLIKYQTTLETEGNIPIETAVLKALKNVPDDLAEVGAISPLPSSVIIYQTQIEGNVCYVDLSSEIESELLGVEENIMVYAMVNSIVSLESASSVCFTVEGEKVDAIRDFEGFHLRMTSDNSLCVEDYDSLSK
ncbi:MAG: GerMN domain-containing protein [Clostridiales bacterium]|nr:GerMN domain-containing protein [Clostridiales bacterium]